MFLRSPLRVSVDSQLSCLTVACCLPLNSTSTPDYCSAQSSYSRSGLLLDSQAPPNGCFLLPFLRKDREYQIFHALPIPSFPTHDTLLVSRITFSLGVDMPREIASAEEICLQSKPQRVSTGLSFPGSMKGMINRKGIPSSKDDLWGSIRSVKFCCGLRRCHRGYGFRTPTGSQVTFGSYNSSAGSCRRTRRSISAGSGGVVTHFACPGCGHSSSSVRFYSPYLPVSCR